MGDPPSESGALFLHCFLLFCPQFVLKSRLYSTFRIRNALLCFILVSDWFHRREMRHIQIFATSIDVIAVEFS